VPQIFKSNMPHDSAELSLSRNSQSCGDDDLEGRLIDAQNAVLAKNRRHICFCIGGFVVGAGIFLAIGIEFFKLPFPDNTHIYTPIATMKSGSFRSEGITVHHTGPAVGMVTLLASLTLDIDNPNTFDTTFKSATTEVWYLEPAGQVPPVPPSDPLFPPPLSGPHWLLPSNGSLFPPPPPPTPAPQPPTYALIGSEQIAKEVNLKSKQTTSVKLNIRLVNKPENELLLNWLEFSCDDPAGTVGLKFEIKDISVSVNSRETPLPALVFTEVLTDCSDASCSDEPSNWRSSEGDPCSTYQRERYCTSVGSEGDGWDPGWGPISDFADSNGISALDACCGCGGGRKAFVV